MSLRQPPEPPLDLLVVGSSPISLLHAIRHKLSHGGQVQVVEKNQDIGGMWQVEDLFGVEGVEIGPHVMRRSRRAYRFLTDELGLGMEAMQPAPVRAVKINGANGFVPYEQDWRLCARELLQWKQPGYWRVAATGVEALKPLVAGVKHYARYLRNGRVTQHYPRGGCIELLAALRRKLDELGIPVLMGEAVLSIDVDTRRGESMVRTSVDAYRSRAVAINPHACLALSLDGIARPVPRKDASTVQAHFLVAGPAQPGIGFAFLGEESMVRMASDISRFCPGLEQTHPGHRLVTAWINPALQDPEDGGKLFGFLRDEGIIPRESTLVRYSQRTLPRSRIPQQDQQDMNRELAPLLTILGTDDLTIDLERSLPRFGWRRFAGRQNSSGHSGFRFRQDAQQ